MKERLCPACQTHSRHSKADWEYHPEAGHGFIDNQGWTLPYLNPKDPPKEI